MATSPSMLLRRAWDGLTRLLVPVPRIGVATSAMPAQDTSFTALDSLSSMARFPWVRAAAMAQVDDLARLPIVAMKRGRAGSGAGAKVDDPGLGLLLRPSERYTSRQLRRQAYLDYIMTGRSYTWVRPDPGGNPSMRTLCRLHPNLTTPYYDGFGLIDHYAYRSGGTTIEVPWREMLAVVQVSWQDDIRAGLGEGPIRSLAGGLNAEMHAERLAAKASKRGRPDVIISPTSDLVGFGDEGGPKEISEAYERKMRNGDGAMVIGAGAKVDVVAFTARDMEFSQMREDNRFAVMAAIGTPSARVGLPGESYNGSKQQLRLYWEQLMSIAASFDDAWSQLAVGQGVRLAHSFVDVEALQVSRSERQQRTALWVDMGATPAKAAEYEGFTDAPVPDEPLVKADGTGLPQRRPPRKPEEPQAKQAALGDAVMDYLRGAAERIECDAQEAIEVGRLANVLDSHGVERSEWWATQIVGVTFEAVRQAAGVEDIALVGLSAFSPTRANAIVRAIREAA